MKLKILGSGGAMPTPRPFCQCDLCQKARLEGEPYKRNSSSLYIEAALAVIDCPEDIGDSLNRRMIDRVDNLFLTHWHPDHTFGLRPILEANFDFINNKTSKVMNLYMPEKVYEQVNKVYPNFYYFEHIAKMCVVHKLNHMESVQIGPCKITAIGFEGKCSNTFGYLIEESGRSALYAPCDTISFNYDIHNDLDLLINECGILSPEVETEQSFDSHMQVISKLNIQRTILTHIEEVELQRYGMPYYRALKDKYQDINFDYAYDGMEIEL